MTMIEVDKDFVTNINVTKTVDKNIPNWRDRIIRTNNIPLKWIISLFIGCIGVVAAELPPVIRIGKWLMLHSCMV